MANTIHDLRIAFLIANSKTAPKLIGNFGEAYAFEWLKEDGWDFFAVDQSPPVPQVLQQYGAKRPDFFGEKNGLICALDAKLQDGESGTSFEMSETEIQKHKRS
jgi:hypothetical protein